MERKIDWTVFLFILGYHVLLIVFLQIYLFTRGLPSKEILYSFLILFIAAGISITAGYHRFYSHKSYRANKFLESVLLFFGTLALQGSVISWVHGHRLHHSYVDTEKDPYCIKKGFLFAHMVWLFYIPEPIKKEIVSDLYQKRYLRFQHKYYNLLAVSLNVFIALFLGFLFGDIFGGFVFLLLFRIFATHHTTWFINSLAHTWGKQSFSKELSAVDNYIIALLTFGEGYHNFHHTFPTDYRNGIKWYHFDPTKWLIWISSKIGLVKGYSKVNNKIIYERIKSEEKLHILH
jgi:stearoyl-CoA desaturase (delta-9 desaturase)